MASFTFNEGANEVNNGDVDLLTGAVKILLLRETALPDKDNATVAAVLAVVAELSVTGYTGGFGGAGRKTLASRTVTKDTGTDRSIFDAADPSAWTALGVGQTIGGWLVFFEITSDALSIPMFFLDPTDTPTNGGDYTAQFNAGGIGYTQQ